MMAPTHIAFAVAIGQLSGVHGLDLKLLAGGALLPDLDHPQSFLGRIFFFLSLPINKHLGHRKAIHGFALWSLVCIVGIWWRPALWIGLGAISHVLIDCWNLSGVQALEPFSEKVCVIFNRGWRIETSSRKEFMILAVLALGVLGTSHVSSMGGLKTMLAELLGTYQIAHERYIHEGLKKCELEGKLRYVDGSIIQGQWPIIGSEGANGLAILDGTKLLHIPKEAEFLRVRLRVSTQEWKTLQVQGVAETERQIFFFSKKKNQWIIAPAGSIVSGHVIGDDIRIKPAELLK